MQQIVHEMDLAMMLVASLPTRKGDPPTRSEPYRYQDRSGRWYERQADGSVRRLEADGSR